MSFRAAHWLWLLLGAGALAGAYAWLQWRRRAVAVRFATLPLLATIAPRRPGWRRHLPAAAFLLAMVALVVGLARPARTELVPRERATIVMALDVSLSMQATDVEPSRIVAAKRAATDFVRLLPKRLNVGLVSFAGGATLAVVPTTDHDAVVEAIDSLELAPATAIGEAVFASLEAAKRVPGDDSGEAPKARIVLMSDGTTTSGRPNTDAATAAKEAGIPVSTIAFGTENGSVSVQGQDIQVPVDREALQELAATTGGSYFSAASADRLRQVYRDIGSQVGFRKELREVTTWFVGLGVALLFAAAAMSLAWSARLP